jgi:Na+-driven multidrug efflux pump
MVGQSFCLTVQDTRTPALVGASVASITNISGDLLLRWQGMQGAAIATDVAVSASAAILLPQVWQQVKVRRVLLVKEAKQITNKQGQERMTVTSDVGQPIFPTQATSATSQSSTLIEVNMTQAFESTSAIISAKMQATGPTPESPPVISFMSLPDCEMLVELVGLSGPLSFNIMGKIVCYSALTLWCTAYGVIPLTAHTIMMRLFFLYGCFGYSIGQTAQAFLRRQYIPSITK